jgi:zona occludens toxin
VKINLTGLVLLTGLPGAGKTLRMMEYMDAAVKAGRPCYASNINGLNVPGVIDFPDPTKWRELEPTAVLFVDEAQKFFRARAGVVRVPDYITDMETIRHEGVCIVMTTQRPTYLDKHMRGLVGRHEHLVELVAGVQSNVYAFRECCETLTDGDKAAAGFEVWLHPRRLHDRYKSAQVHTKKARLPKKLVMLVCMVIFAVGLLVWAFFIRDSRPKAGTLQAAKAAGAFRSGGGVTAEGKPIPLTTAEYASKLIPRFPTMPWTAIAYDERPVTSDPGLFCISSQAGTDAQGKFSEPGCTCVTEQGTAYDIDPAMCRSVARRGAPYNPYKQRGDRGDMAGHEDRGQGVPEVRRPAPDEMVKVESLAGGGPASEPAKYGAMRPAAVK